MVEDHLKDNPELARLYRRYQESPRSHNFAPLADACRKAGLLQEAVDICQQGLEEHPDYSSGHVVMGKCLYDQGRIEEARHSFERVLDMDRENLVALKFLGTICAEQGDVDSAGGHFKRILVLDPDNREIRDKLDDLDSIGEEEILELTAIEDEDFEGDEIALGEESLEISDELATMTLADIFASQGYRGKAIKIYEEVLGKDPSNPAVREKLEALTGTRKVDSQAPAETAGTPWDDSGGSAPAEEWSVDAPEDEPAVPGEREAADRDVRDGAEGAEQARESAERSRRKSAPQKIEHDDETIIADEQSLAQFKNWLKNAGK